MANPTAVLTVLAMLLGFASALPARAGEAQGRSVSGVVEIFTSQGCAACNDVTPLIRSYAARPDVAALAYHVDYWNYLGWHDTLGSRRNTERQKSYAARLGSGALVTPQFVVNGRVAGEGGDRERIDAAIRSAPLGTAGAPPRIRLERVDDRLRIAAEAAASPEGGAPPVLVLVTFSRDLSTKVSSGENRDRTLEDARAVIDWRAVGLLEDGEPLEVEIPLTMLAVGRAEKAGCVALLQEMGPDDQPGAILAAAVIDF